MIRILYITRARLSFSRAHARNIIKTAEYLNQELGCAVTVFSSAAEPQGASDILEAKRVTHHVVLDVCPRKRSLMIALFFSRTSFDALYFRDPLLCYIAVIARFLLWKKIIFEAHGSHEWRLMKPFWLLSFFVSDGTVYITEKLRQWYDPKHKKKSVVVFPNAPDFDLFSGKEDARTFVRRTLQIPDGAYLLMFGGSTLWYDVDFLIRLLPLLPLRTVLVLVGLKDAEEQALRNMAVTGGVVNRVRFVRRVSHTEFPRYLLAADVLLIPPTLTFPGSICSKLSEYLAAGLPIISHKAGANDEILRHGKNAFVIQNNSLDEYVTYILQVMNNTALAASLGTQAAEDARYYTGERRGKAIAAFIQSVVS